MSKVQALGLQTSLNFGAYDQTKTTMQGRVGQRTITDGNGAKVCIGAQPVVTADIFDDTGVAPVAIHCSTPNGRVFIGKGIVAGLWTISLYNLTTVSGVTTTSWVGDLKLQMTNTGVYTIKGFSVDDTTPSAMKISWVATNTTAIQGGLYATFGADVADFVKVSVPTYPVATAGSTNKVVYQIGDQATQAAQTVTVADGVDIDKTNGFFYIWNGLAATPKIFKLTATVPTATPTTGYTIANGTIVVTAALPALSGTVLLFNCVQVFTPTAQPSPNTGNNGSPCIGLLTTTNIYWAKLSDVTNGASTLPSLLTATLGLSGDYLTPTAAFGQYSAMLDKWVIMTTLGRTLVKYGINADSTAKIFGLNDAIKTETGGTVTPSDFGGITNLCLTDMNGWAILTNTFVGQRNFVAIDLFSDETSTTSGQINSSIISPVMSGNYSKGIMMGRFYELGKRSEKSTLQYRTSNFSIGPGAGFDATWTTAPRDGDLSAISNATQIQFRFLFTMMGSEVTNPPQIIENYFVYTDFTQSSDNWVGSSSNTSASGANPFYVAFRLQTAYATSVPRLYVRGVDDSGNAVVFDTTTNASLFTYSTNNGTSWNALGTIPNTPLTTEVRLGWTAPDGVARRWSVSES